MTARFVAVVRLGILHSTNVIRARLVRNQNVLYLLVIQAQRLMLG